MSDDALIYCPECHAETLKKKISAAAFQLKGSGWYETDFKNSGAKPNGKSNGKEAAKTSSSDSSSKDKKSSGAAQSGSSGCNHAA